MNSVVLIGRVTSEIRCRYLSSQIAVATFNVAVDREKSKEKETDFPKVTVFGKQAENCEKFVSKGDRIGVKGSIRTGSYEDKEGKTIYTTEVVAERVEFLEGKKESLKGKGGEDGPSSPDIFAEIDEDIPF